MTNIENLDSAIRADRKSFDIQEIFRDFKSGGYNLEETKITYFRLRVIILLIMIAYTAATFQGKRIKQMGLQKYVGRVKEFGRTFRQHSSFYIGLYGESSAALRVSLRRQLAFPLGQTWVKFIEQCAEAVAELMRLTRLGVEVLSTRSEG